MNELSAILNGAAFAPIETTGWLRVTGSDRVRWLNGMVTNSIQALKPGEGNYSFILNAQGRIQGDMTAFLLPDAILLETGQAGAVVTHLDHFIIMDDVELAVLGLSQTGSGLPHDASEPLADRAGLLLMGPQAAELLSAHRLIVPDPMRLEHATWEQAQVEVIAAYAPLVPRFEVWGPIAAIGEISQSFQGKNVARVGAEALEQLRVLEGRPLYGVDIRDRDLPQETNQNRALHFNKGCYLGQEIVERIRSRGQVHRTFSGFRLTGELPAAGTALQSEDKTVGEITTAVGLEHPDAGPLQLALGYLRREALERKEPLEYTGGTATPVSLPFSA